MHLKLILSVYLFVISFFASAQDAYRTLRKIDSIAEDIERFGTPPNKFHKEGFAIYSVSTINEMPSRFILNMKSGPNKITETFYVKDTVLILCIKETQNDIVYGTELKKEKFYFENGKMIGYILKDPLDPKSTALSFGFEEVKDFRKVKEAFRKYRNK